MVGPGHLVRGSDFLLEGIFGDKLFIGAIFKLQILIT